MKGIIIWLLVVAAIVFGIYYFVRDPDTDVTPAGADQSGILDDDFDADTENGTSTNSGFEDKG